MENQFKPNWYYVFSNPFFITRRYLYLAIQKAAAKIQGTTLLDVGCGTKPYRALFQFEKYIGLDYQKEGQPPNPEADLLYSGDKFPLKNGSVDCVLATEVLEHVFEPEAFLSEINRVLKRRGHLLLTVPFVWDEHEQPYDFARYTSYGLPALLERNGFKVEHFEKTGNFITALGQVFCTYWYHLLVFSPPLMKVASVTLFPALQLGTYFLAWLLPTRDGLYLDNVVLCQKK